MSGKAFFIFSVIALLIIGFNACSEVTFKRGQESNNKFVEVEVEPPVPGTPIPPDVIDDFPECENVTVGDFRGYCVVFHDSFEGRTLLVEDDVFHWDFLKFDNGGNGTNLSAAIKNQQHTGPVTDGSQSVVFSGRQGSSKHELYLVSTPLPVDLSEFDTVYIQYDYLPIGLEDSIELHGFDFPESVRIDVCNVEDGDCKSSEVFGDMDNWTRMYNQFALGTGLNIRNYELSDWQTGQAIVDLSLLPDSRKKEFVFRVTAAMTDGYIGNNDSNLMDDGVIFDNIFVIGIKR